MLARLKPLTLKRMNYGMPLHSKNAQLVGLRSHHLCRRWLQSGLNRHQQFVVANCPTGNRVAYLVTGF